MSFQRQPPDGPQSLIWAFGRRDNDQNAQPPPASITDPLFSAVDPGGDPNQGGLGMNRAQTFLADFPAPQPFTCAN